MSVSIFSPIHSGLVSHTMEKCAFLRPFTQVFDFGQNAYTISACDQHAMMLEEKNKLKHPWIQTLVRVVALMTVIIPLLALLGTLIYRAVNTFQLQNPGFNEDEDIKKYIMSYLDQKDLVAYRATSLRHRELANFELINRINKGVITFADLGIKQLTDVSVFFGKNCSMIHKWDLRSFAGIQDKDIEEIARSFPVIKELILKDALITDQSVALFKEMSSIKSFGFEGCKQISDFSFLKECSLLTSLNLAGCQPIDTKFLEKHSLLTNLSLKGQTGIKDFSFLKNLPYLISLDLVECKCYSDDFAFLENPLLTSLNLSECRKIKDFAFLEKYKSLTNLGLSRCKTNDFSFLEKLPHLKSLDLSKCYHLSDIDLKFLAHCPSLTSLDLSYCNGLIDLRYLRFHKPPLTSLALANCTNVNLYGTLKHFPLITSLVLSNCVQITDFSILKHCPLLTHLDIYKVPFIPLHMPFFPNLKNLISTGIPEIDNELLANLRKFILQ